MRVAGVARRTLVTLRTISRGTWIGETLNLNLINSQPPTPNSQGDHSRSTVRPLGVGRYLISGFLAEVPRAVPRGCAAADAAPALSVRGRLPRAGKRAPLIPSLRSRARRVRDALRRPMRCGRCAWGCQHRTDRWARTRRGESLRPFSRAGAHSGRSAWLAPDVLGRPRPALRHRQPCPVIID